ncbi:ATP-binding protein [Natranaerobius thermophilus]|uniref:AAA ATPase n=1 Tax=Natranaerobius thermophilus (strain ATCC BAA-1301 / DSM 18059 / JW/NM-WN-LF) TaxID=457570 RepID=B2A703_NATTJ|nr:ATPase AAA [Natranaerobius thermophilus]ACB85594.1 AAA ATPase [Natranaerobius thermophilus JW/NM-WN-LF]
MKYAQGQVIHDGNQDLYKLLKVSTISTYLGIPHHIHAEGVRGTGKTTLFRGVGKNLPKIIRIKDCVYNCHPLKPHCPQHKDLNREEVAKLETEWIQMPFMEISHGAKLGTVLGSIDLKKITDQNQPLAGILPGVIPRAHRGIIFIDEINRLADTSPELTDVLLDVMGTKPGKVQIEETGLTKVELQVNLGVWAASNPDEDPGSLQNIRKQLSDRFDFSTNVFRPAEPKVVQKILAGQSNPKTVEDDLNRILKNFSHCRTKESESETEGLVDFPQELSELLAKIYIDYSIESMRAIKAIRFGAIFHALMNKEINYDNNSSQAGLLNTGAYADSVDIDDILQIAEHTLKHRVSDETKKSIIQELENYKYRKEQPQVSNSNYDNHDQSHSKQDFNKKSTMRSQQFISNLVSRIKRSLQKPTKEKVKTTGDRGKSLMELAQEDKDSKELIKEGKREK